MMREACRFIFLVFLFLIFTQDYTLASEQAVKLQKPITYREQFVHPRIIDVDEAVDECGVDWKDIGLFKDYILEYDVPNLSGYDKGKFKIWSSNADVRGGILNRGDGLDYGKDVNNKIRLCLGSTRYDHHIGGSPLRGDFVDLVLWYDNPTTPTRNATCISEPKSGGMLCWLNNGSSKKCAEAVDRYFFQFNEGFYWHVGIDACPSEISNAVVSTFEDIAEVNGSVSTSFGTYVEKTNISSPDEGYVDPVVNHEHAIGMHYVKYRMSDQSNWHDGVTTVGQGTDQNLHVRVKVKEKEGWEWNDIYVDLYHSENRWFSRSHDTLVATKRIKELGKKEKESAYFNDINISNLSIGHHYYFADIRYSRPGLNDHNVSSRSDDTEYVVIDVQDSNKLPVGYVDNANCTQISGWAQDADTTSAVNVHIYDGSTFLSNVYANSYRSDVGNHAFTYAIPTAHKDGTQHTYRVFAINEPSGSNPLLSQGSLSFACGNNGAVPTTRFYNSRVDAHFYSTNAADQIRIPVKYPDWANHGTSFNAFPESQSGTVPLYTCWTGSTHDYVLDLTQIGYYKPCLEQPYRLFDVYPTGGEGRIPVHLMYKESADTLILSNGEDDAMYLQNVHGFGFTDEDPLFWAPTSLFVGTTAINPPDNNASQVPLTSSIDEHEQDVVNRVMMILLQ